MSLVRGEVGALKQGQRFSSQYTLPQKHGIMVTTTIAASPTTALLRHRVSCLIAALFAMGVAGLKFNAAVGARLGADTVLLFEAGLLVEGGMVDVGKLADGAELFDSIKLVNGVELVGGVELVDRAELVVVVVTINNLSWTTVTV